MLQIYIYICIYYARLLQELGWALRFSDPWSIYISPISKWENFTYNWVLFTHLLEEGPAPPNCEARFLTSNSSTATYSSESAEPERRQATSVLFPASAIRAWQRQELLSHFRHDFINKHGETWWLNQWGFHQQLLGFQQQQQQQQQQPPPPPSRPPQPQQQQRQPQQRRITKPLTFCRKKTRVFGRKVSIFHQSIDALPSHSFLRCDP